MAGNFSFILPGKLAGMEYPGSFGTIEEDLDFLTAQNVGALVNLTFRPLNAEHLKPYNFALLDLPIEDFGIPDIAQINCFVQYVDQQIKQKHAVVVHCQAGLGRTGTMLACYLVYTGLSPEAAIEDIRKLRIGSIETVRQEQVIKAYAHECKRRQ